VQVCGGRRRRDLRVLGRVRRLEREFRERPGWWMWWLEHGGVDRQGGSAAGRGSRQQVVRPVAAVEGPRRCDDGDAREEDY
jgi:hypothetical protein